jgi:Tfp pilus assembly protein PilX
MSGRESGFALIAALLALWILTAVGVLVFTVTTQDVRISSRMVGEKKAFFSTEAGVHSLTRGFDPLNLSDTSKYNRDFYVNTGLDPYSRYRIGPPAVPTSGPSAVPLIGYSTGGQQQWGSTRFVTTVTGTNAKYNSTVQVDVGVGFGPVEITTAYR